MLKLDGVSKVYRVGAFGRRTLTAVSDVSFEVNAGEVVSLIGESGSGKSTIGRMILRLTPVSGGTITFDGADLAAKERRPKDYYRSVQGVFQDPFSCFNPVFKADRAFAVIKEAYFPEVDAAEWRGRVESALESVRLDPGQVLGRYPHQLSGGQLQRMLIARAVLLDIRLLVADEIISMLDASTRIDVLNLLADLRARGLGILFVTHDLSLGNYVSDRTVVLRHGKIVEMGRTELVFGDPRHPYTRTLLASVPRLDAKWAHEPAPDGESGAEGEGAEATADDDQSGAASAGSASAGGDSAGGDSAGAAEAAGPCPYHDSPQERRTRPGLAEVEDDHFVACSGCPAEPRPLETAKENA